MKKIRQTVEVSDAIVTLSGSTKQDLLSFFDYPEDRIHIIPPGIESRFLSYLTDQTYAESALAKYRLQTKSYFIYVGHISFRKNVPALVRAYAQSSAVDSTDLVLVGPKSPIVSEIETIAKDLGIESQVKVIGKVPDEDLPSLYANSRGFMFPTFYEGFGLPILEAMACKTPVLIGNCGSAPEVAGGFATMVDPFDLDSIAQGINQLLESAHPCLNEAAHHAANYTWSSCVNQTVELYESVLNL